MASDSTKTGNGGMLFPSFLSRCFRFGSDYYFDGRKLCCTKYPSVTDRNTTSYILRLCKCIFGCDTENSPFYDFELWSPSDRRMGTSSGFSQQLRFTSVTSTPTPEQTDSWNTDKLLRIIAYKVLLPVVIILVGICLVLGITLIVKSYMMKPVKQNLAVAIRRRRRTGHAPDNHYIPPEAIRASFSRCSDRKSLPPPEVIIAARERASQIYHI
jgi:hypothetical protein